MSLTLTLLAVFALGAANAAVPSGCIDENYNTYPVGPIDRGNACEECTCTDYREIVCNVKQGPVDSSNPCEVCECNGYGSLSCSATECPTLDCPEEFRIREDGACCDTCAPACKHNYQWYRVGDKVDRGHKCENCVCGEDLEVKCEHVPCPRLPCYPSQYVKDEGACCEHCPPGCKEGYVYHLVGDKVDRGDKCENCQCMENGEVQCSAAVCPTLYCDNQVTPYGECCPRCQY